ncbi:MAG: hypothetical protein FJZ96_09735 [Chloroflexi bacterium]|nr:hypothetical protein [Chloroflexota bacterium]
MSDLFERVTGDQDIFKKIASYIPGFKGYIERQNRRAADKLLREQVSLRYTELYNRASYLQKDIADSGAIPLLDDAEAIATKLRTFADKIKTASYGYSGFFDAVKINEEELAQLYSFDAAFFELADQIAGGLDNLEASIGSDGLKAAIRSVDTLARQAVETYERRYEVITAGSRQ